MDRAEYLEEFFTKKRKDISFISLRKGARVNFKDKAYVTTKELPVPVRLERLLEDIRKQGQIDGITLNNIIDGIIYLFGTDKDFEYIKDYKDMFEKLSFGFMPYIIYCINNDIKAEDGVVYGKALVNSEENEKTCFIYASCLEKMGMDLHEKGKDTSRYFLEEANYYFEKCLDYNDRFSLAYYKLGYYYKRKQQYIKAELTWQKHQELDDDDLRVEEIRNELIQLKPYIDFEKGYNLVLKEKPDEALDLLLPLVKDYSGWWNLLFFIGLAYRSKGEYDIAEKYFENVLKIDPVQKESLNELGLCKIVMGKYVEAAELFTKLLSLDPGNCEVFCNRAVAYLYNNQMDKAREDIQTALKINPNDPVALSIKEELEKNIET
ncbi:MAG: tetratricopeptide repeat protein [Sedimentibacter sp.]|jgi:tetratricopeptide (TPR) repeat protein|nr:tetratricopeptide repeat protein [Sedimentibacter sp.]